MHPVAKLLADPMDAPCFRILLCHNPRTQIADVVFGTAENVEHAKEVLLLFRVGGWERLSQDGVLGLGRYTALKAVYPPLEVGGTLAMLV